MLRVEPVTGATGDRGRVCWRQGGWASDLEGLTSTFFFSGFRDEPREKGPVLHRPRERGGWAGIDCGCGLGQLVREKESGRGIDCDREGTGDEERETERTDQFHDHFFFNSGQLLVRVP